MTRRLPHRVRAFRLGPLLALVCSASAAAAPAPQETHDYPAETLRVGHWVQLKGEYAKGRFRVADIELLPPDDKQTLIGKVERILDADRFLILGQQVHLSDKTEWKDFSRADLDGAFVKVTGRYRDPKKFSAREISARKPGRSSLEGRIDRIEPRGEELELTVMNYRVLVPRRLEVESEAPIETLALAPESEASTFSGSRDDDDDLPGTLFLTPDLRLGGQLELKHTHEDEFDLDETDAEDRDDTDASLRAALVWTPMEDFFALVDGRAAVRWREDQEDGFERTDGATLNEAYGYWRNLADSGWDLQAGRQDFDEKREWLYDQNLDALRAIRSTPTYRLELSLSQVLHDGSDLDEDLFNTMVYFSNNSRKKHAALYAVDRRDGDDSRTHLGGRLFGEWLPRSEVWLEAAALTGEFADQDLQGFGFDLGATFAPSESLPAFSVGYALGSGDDDGGDGTDHTFRQTGFHDNNDKWSGVTSFRYYGELVDPELANLSILTAGIGGRFGDRSSIDLVWHKYAQVETSTSLVSTEIDADPDGVHDDLGWELDLVWGNRSRSYLDLEFVAGYFEPGEAFPDADPAWLAALQLRFKF